MMVRILVLKRLYNLSDEQMEDQWLDRMSDKRFCGLASAATIPDRTTVWTFESRIGEAGARVLFDGVTTQLFKHGFIARGSQIVDATLVPMPKQRNRRDENTLVKSGAMPADWTPAKRRQNDTDATWTQKLGKNHFGDKFSSNVDAKYKVIRQLATGTASTHDSTDVESLIDRWNTRRDVDADRGDASAERERWLKAHGDRHQVQRKGVSVRRNTSIPPTARSA